MSEELSVHPLATYAWVLLSYLYSNRKDAPGYQPRWGRRQRSPNDLPCPRSCTIL